MSDTNRYREIYFRIRDSIAAAKLQPGDRLHTGTTSGHSLSCRHCPGDQVSRRAGRDHRRIPGSSRPGLSYHTQLRPAGLDRNTRLWLHAPGHQEDDDVAMARAAAGVGLRPLALSNLAQGSPASKGLLLGFSNVREADARRTIAQLAAATVAGLRRR